MEKHSEKLLERNLRQGIEKSGGWCIKMVSPTMTGLPDRICLLPGGRVFFVEVKSTGKKPTKIQELVHRRLRKMGFRVEVIDTPEGLEHVLCSL